MTPLEAVLRRDRLVVLGAILLVAGLAWAYTIYIAWNTGNLGDGSSVGISMAMPHLAAWGAADWGAMFAMWAVMMAAMMVPTAAPMILLFATVNRRRLEQQQPYVSTLVFLGGYVVIWVGFAVAATVGNWALHTHALLSSMMGSTTSSILGGALLLAAGVFQWSPLKYACLSHCRTPLGFLMSDWREGTGGALKMGLKHGVYCLGCCWILMALLFVLGVMNVVWIAALAAFVLVEKVAPKGQMVSRAAGLLLMAWGGLVVSGMWS
ncbi:MAG: hypothetical protein BZY88_07150 [SAR202 cluster bacterium Io17-Chloro-G9]|nr:MAG: hypothetical protein BZY88_07150 [SAR202 cluster bacterium Io17-Chloro-G9]